MGFRIQVVRGEAAAAPTRRRRRWTVAAATVVAGVLVTGVSYAYWTATGSGTASVAAVAAKAVSVAPVAVKDMYPGKVDDLAVALTNTNPYNVKVSITSLAAGSITGANGTCAASNFTVKTTGPYSVGLVVVNAGATVNVTITGAVTMDPNAQDGCQNASLPVTVTVDGNQI